MSDKSIDIDEVIARIRMHGSFQVAMQEVETGIYQGRYVEGADYYIDGPENGLICPSPIVDEYPRPEKS